MRIRFFNASVFVRALLSGTIFSCIVPNAASIDNDKSSIDVFSIV